MNWRIIGAHLRNFFTSLKRGARKSDEALQNSLRDTASRMKEKARNAKQRGGYK